MTLPNKYEMPKEENIFIAKRVLVDSVYQQANLEGIGVTFADTQDILNNVNVPSLTPTEISKVCCLRDGWEFLLENIDPPPPTWSLSISGKIKDRGGHYQRNQMASKAP